MNYGKFLLSIFLLLPAVAFTQDSLSIDAVIRTVLQNHPDIIRAIRQTEAAEARVGQAASNGLPEAGIDASYARIGPVPQLNIPVMGSFKLYPEDNYDAHLGCRYTVFDFGKTSASVDAARAGVDFARDAVELTKSDLGYQTVRVFYNILFLQKSIGVADEQIETLGQHLFITKKKVEAGTATTFDVLTTQVRVASAQNQKADLENSLHQQEAFLRQLLGLKEETPVLLKGEFLLLPVSLDMDSLMQTALAQRLEMKMARDSRAEAGFRYKSAARGNYPSLKINATWGVKNGYIPDLDIMRGNWTAAAQVQIPIFDGDRAGSRQEEAQANILAEEARIRGMEQQVRHDVERAMDDIKTAVTRLEISRIQVEQSSEAVSVARKRYETGSGTNVDLLDTETAESEAKLNSLQALFKYVMGKYELDRATGKQLYKKASE
jgi:outer membrane protein